MTNLNTESSFDYDAASARLASISAAPDVREGLERVKATGDLDDDFLSAVVETDLSLDWIFTGKGEPYGKAFEGGDGTVAEFFQNYRCLNANHRRILRELLREMAGKPPA